MNEVPVSKEGLNKLETFIESLHVISPLVKPLPSAPLQFG